MKTFIVGLLLAFAFVFGGCGGEMTAAEMCDSICPNGVVAGAECQCYCMNAAGTRGVNVTWEYLKEKDLAHAQQDWAAAQAKYCQ